MSQLSRAIVPTPSQCHIDVTRSLQRRRRDTFGLAVILFSIAHSGGGCARPDPVFTTQRRKPLPIKKIIRRPAPTPPKPRVQPLAGRTIIVDAGHGGRDPGTLGVGIISEKTVNLNIATQLATRLKKYGANVISSRTTDVFIPLDDRAGLAERSRTDLFVSIHSDACRDSNVTGATVYPHVA